jgi:hypothetical protein
MGVATASLPSRTEYSKSSRPPTRQRRPGAPGVPAPVRYRHGRGGRVLFEVPFHSAMSASDLALLARLLDLSTHTYQKMRPDPTSPGVARLDHFSGLFLERGQADGQWVLEARTWGNPAPVSVHGWHLLSADAARQLDPTVGVPPRLPQARVELAGHPVGWVQNRPLAAFRRRLVGLR